MFSTLSIPLTLNFVVSVPNLHVFATTLCILTLRPTYLTFLPFTLLPVSFAQVLTTMSSVVHLSVRYHMVKGLSHTPPLLLGTLFLSRSALLIMSLRSDPELKPGLLKLTFSVLPINCCKLSFVVLNPLSAVLLDEWCFVMFRQCYVSVTMFLTRFNKIAIQGTPQMAVDKEAICLSRVYSYYPKCNFPLFYV